MQFIADWKRVFAVSLSFWTLVLGFLILLVPEAVFRFTGADTNPYLVGWFAVFLFVAGMVGRFVKQDGSKRREWLRILGVVLGALVIAMALSGQGIAGQMAESREAATLKIAVPFIAAKEGKRNRAYLDVVGVPTICYGSTRGVKLGMVKTNAECTALLRDEVAEYRHGLHPYFTKTTKSRRLPPSRDAAFTSLAFNCGIRAIGRSTATRRLNSGDIRGACHAITWWNKAGGRVWRGLVVRRSAERDLCLGNGT
ncbi:endolysin [Roseibium sp. TrichSKD4]|uniref:lysozyme n=1 Tax=Roseibium sp. TrichSKD4 TaxID=744980 RepID=UPI0001E56F4A|nr:lysozyme [Roseibium sp. TrichSKD4]EFO31333.1 endolysin [Roseibium sp. TrichSKD4]